MKANSLKIITLIPLLTLTCLLVLPVMAQVNYAVSGGAAYVTRSPYASGNIVIASKYQGNPVIGIGYQAFYNCANLTGVTIPSSVTNIGGEAFGGCTSLTNVTIGSGVTTIMDSMFRNCTSILNFSVASANPAYSSLDGVLFNKAQTTLIRFPRARSGSYTIPSSVTNIVEDSGNFDSAFFNCYKLTSVTIPSSVTSIGFWTFFLCSSLTNATIPNSVTNIGSGAFQSCSRLTDAAIPSSVSSIGSGAFYRCSGLTNFTVAEANPVYSSLNGLWFNKAQTTLIQFPGGRGGSCVVPDSVTSIASAAFAYSGLVSVTIPNGVTSIGNSAFERCSSLTSVIIPNNVTNLGEYMFYNCSSLTNVVIGNSVTALRDSTFFSCTNLTSVTIPDSVTSIEYGAFYGCRSLTSMTIPNSVTNLGNSAFKLCTRLMAVTLPSNITRIGDSTFYACSNLTSVTIPNGVTNIGFNAFFTCTSLTNITVLGDCPALAANVFVGVPAAARVYYYYGTTGWGATYGGLPTVMLYPPPQVLSASAGVQPGGYGFTLTGVTNQTIVIEASTNLATWQPVWTNNLSGVSTNFVDSQWQNHPRRFYRAQSY